MKPELNEGEYIFTTLHSVSNIPVEDIICQFREKEGITLIIERQKADALGLEYTFVSSWITLNVHSSLEATGFTAVFSSELAKHQIGCNVIAGYFHDHIFVGKKDGEKAVNLLKKLAESYI